MFLNQQNNSYALNAASVRFMTVNHLFLNSSIPLVVEIDPSIFTGEGTYRLIMVNSYLWRDGVSLNAPNAPSFVDVTSFFNMVMPAGFKLDRVTYSYTSVSGTFGNFLAFEIRKAVFIN